MATLHEIALQYATKQPKQVDYVTEGAPIMARVPYFPTSHGLKHAYERLAEVTGGSFVDMDAPLPDVAVSGELDWKELSILGGLIDAGEDKLTAFGGMSGYLAKRMPKIIRKTAATAEYQFIYNVLAPFALANDKVQDAAGDSDTNYSIYVVTWAEEEVCGLYDPNGFGQGTMFEVEPINGGNRYKDSNGVIVRGATMKSYIGFMLENPRYVSGIVNIELTSGAVADALSQQLTDAIIDARAGSGIATEIYMHPKLLGKLGKFKESKLHVVPGDSNYKRTITMWDDVEIVTSYNFLDGTETDVTVS